MNVTLFYVIVALTSLMTSHAYLHSHRALRRGHVSDSLDGEGLVEKREAESSISKLQFIFLIQQFTGRCC